jgi:RNA polymerase sigma-70 factor (ECF subfamily)
MLAAVLGRVPEPSGLSLGELEPHRRLLWGVCYRMTGVAADADDLVQETFVRALTAPPADRERDVLPWLVRVAMNASRDVLRRRKREAYVGPWLPSPVDLEQCVVDGATPAARYSQRESVSYAFMRALEALSSSQRAIVILRDVLDYSVKEAAEVLDMSEANVKTSHHRARARLESYEAEPAQLDEAAIARARGAMARFFAHLALDDVQGLERMLAASVEGLNDGGGEYFAATRPVLTPHRVARFYLRLSAKNRVLRAIPCQLSGLPAVIAQVTPFMPGIAPWNVNLFACDRSGAIIGAYSVVAPRKIAHLHGR